MAELEAEKPLSAVSAVELAIATAQRAVVCDQDGEIEEALALYVRAVDLIMHGLSSQKDATDAIDKSDLHKYARLYNDRIAELRTAMQQEPADGDDDAAGCGGRAPADPSGDGAALFWLDDEPPADAAPPAPPPAEEWRRTFWLMRALAETMRRGGYLTADRAVYVPRSLWVQRGAKFVALASKAESAEAIGAELGRVRSLEGWREQPGALLAELERACRALDVVQNGLARTLPFVPEARSDEAGGGGLGKLAERFKTLAKSVDKTAARLGAMPAKCADPSEYVCSMLALLDCATGLEDVCEHHLGEDSRPAPAASDAGAAEVEWARVCERLRRCCRFFREVVCAWLLHDFDGLLARHMRKATAALVHS